MSGWRDLSPADIAKISNKNAVVPPSKPTPKPRQKSKLEEALAGQIALLHLPAPEREHYFAKPRRWRLDFAWPALSLAVEVEGGTWASTNGQKSRHSSGQGMRDDAEKYNELALRGWLLIRITPDMIRDGSGITAVERGLEARGGLRSDERPSPPP